MKGTGSLVAWLEAENSSEALLRQGLSEPCENTACQTEEVSLSSSHLPWF